MVQILRKDFGLSDPMANRLFSQIRKGAPLYADWKAAFETERFTQRIGRSTNTYSRPNAPELPTKGRSNRFRKPTSPISTSQLSESEVSQVLLSLALPAQPETESSVKREAPCADVVEFYSEKRQKVEGVVNQTLI